MKITDCWLITY